MLKILKVLLSRNWKDNLHTKTTKTGVFPTFDEEPYDSSAQFLTVRFHHTFRRRRRFVEASTIRDPLLDISHALQSVTAALSRMKPDILTKCR
jgi:hypothetical protein